MAEQATDAARTGAGAGEDLSSTVVLVTGGTGLVSLQCIHLLLHKGYTVRTTVRSVAKRKDVVRWHLSGAYAEPPIAASVLDARLSFVEADLLSDDGWADAVRGVDYVWHVASPFPPSAPRHEDELIRPAREGTLRVLRAAADAKNKGESRVRRIVLTSSIVAVRNGWPAHLPDHTFTEKDWTKLDAPGLSAYPKSKTLAEKAAWEWAETDGKQAGIELATVNPGAVLGPALDPAQDSTSTGIIKQLLNGSIPALPPIRFCIVDVRDVAALHLLAMTSPRAAGQRYLAVTGDPLPMAEIARVLRAGLAEDADKHVAGYARKPPTLVLPTLVAKIAQHVVPQLRANRNELFTQYHASCDKAKEELGWAPRSNEEAILSTAKALIQAKVI